MNKIAELISRLCPDGVEFKTLDSLVSYVQPGPYIVSSTEYDAHYSTPVLTAGQSFILGYTNEEEGIYNASSQKPVIIFDDFTTSFHWVDFDFKVKSSALKILKIKDKQEADFRYIYMAMKTIHFIPTNHMRHWISLYSKFEIPLPPLNIQKEIVSILDSFTSLIDKMKQEVEMRKKQMEYYLNILICKDNVAARLFGDIGVVQRGKRVVRKELALQGCIPVFQNSLTPLGYYQYSNIPANNTFIISAGTAGEIGFSAKPFWAADDCLVISSVLCDSKYLYYYLKTQVQFLKSQIRGGAMKRLSRETIEKLEIPVPSLEKQHQIASILDTFESYISKLEKMIELRQKQYEYYREKLLTFE